MQKMYDDSILADTLFLVGPDEFPFKVHRAFLSSRCEYFQKMFGNGMKESNETVIRFPEKDPQVFKILIDYFYKAKLEITHKVAFEVMKLGDEWGIQRVKEK